MKYAWASITKSCTNFGNFLIEYNLKKLLQERGFPEPEIVFDAFEEGENKGLSLDSADFIIVPGCTTLSTHHYPALRKILLEYPNIKAYNFGAAFFRVTHEESIEVIKRYFAPIGSRDPIADEYLRKYNIQTQLIGCPTLFSSDADAIKPRGSDSILVVFGLNKDEDQAELCKLLKQKGFSVKTIVQEEHQKQIAQKADIEIFEYSPEKLLKLIDESKIVITGRLHAALPAIASGVPVYFLNTFEDIRFSLLNYIGVDFHAIEEAIENVDKIIESPEKYCAKINYTRVEELRNKFLKYIDLVYDDAKKN